MEKLKTIVDTGTGGLAHSNGRKHLMLGTPHSYCICMASTDGRLLQLLGNNSQLQLLPQVLSLHTVYYTLAHRIRTVFASNHFTEVR